MKPTHVIITITVLLLHAIPALSKDSHQSDNKPEYVILLHGMGRSGSSMQTLSEHLDKQGYSTVNVTYPSTSEPIPVIAETCLKQTVERCKQSGAEKIHVVTHSLGGIVLRQYLQSYSLPEGSRVVMLGPPNKGSEIADSLMNFHPYKWFMGDAGQSLGTDETSLVNSLKPVSGNIGIIAGKRTIAPICSWIIPGPDDGKVSVERAQLDEMSDFIVLPISHTFMMSRPPVIEQVTHFLENGYFDKSKSETSC